MTFRRLHTQPRLARASTLAIVAVFLTATNSFAADEHALGNQNYLKGNYAAAKIHYLKAIAANPGRWEAHYQLANTCLQLKDKEGAKKSYIRCLALNPAAEIRAHCERAVGYLSGLPLAPIPGPSPLPAPKVDPSSSHFGQFENSSSADPVKTDAEVQKDANRERIMRQAEADIVKMKEEENARWRELVSQSNRLFRNSEGKVRRDLSPEETAQFFQEVAQKEQAIRERAKRNCDAIR